MNPIHESGFASLMVLFMASIPGGVAALVALILSWKRPKNAVVAANLAVLLSSAVCALAALITIKLHTLVDYWIDTGGYGPVDQVRAQYGAEWHASARLTAWAGLVLTALPFAISALVHVLAGRREPTLEKPTSVLIFAAVTIFGCVLTAIF